MRIAFAVVAAVTLVASAGCDNGKKIEMPSGTVAVPREHEPKGGASGTTTPEKKP
jgi:hypothetical protein